MQVRNRLKNVCAVAALLALGAGVGVAANKYGKPKSVIHVVTLYYKDGTTDEQKKVVLAGVEKMAAEIPGVKNVWLRSVKVQGVYNQIDPEKKTVVATKPFTDAFVMEFEDDAAFKAYDNHPAHREWEKLYVPVRGRSTTHDITN